MCEQVMQRKFQAPQVMRKQYHRTLQRQQKKKL